MGGSAPPAPPSAPRNLLHSRESVTLSPAGREVVWTRAPPCGCVDGGVCRDIGGRCGRRQQRGVVEGTRISSPVPQGSMSSLPPRLDPGSSPPASPSPGWRAGPEDPTLAGALVQQPCCRPPGAGSSCGMCSAWEHFMKDPQGGQDCGGQGVFKCPPGGVGCREQSRG